MFKLIKYIILDIDLNVIFVVIGFKDLIWLLIDLVIKKLELFFLFVSFVMDEV